jgi:hypothetical protein
MPASYGGRISSVVDVQMKEGNMKKWSAQGWHWHHFFQAYG